MYSEVLPARVTGVDEAILKRIGKALVTVPEKMVVDVPIEKSLRGLWRGEGMRAGAGAGGAG